MVLDRDSGTLSNSLISTETGEFVLTLCFASNYQNKLNVSLNCRRWDDLVVSAPFLQIRGGKSIVKRDVEVDTATAAKSRPHVEAFGAVYIFWNQKRHLPDTRAFNHDHSQLVEAPESLSSRSGFGASITSLGDINHDGVAG